MAFLVKAIVLIIGIIVGVACMKYSYQLTRLFGYNTYAERFFGTGGTYSMWKLLGAAVIIGVFVYFFI